MRGREPDTHELPGHRSRDRAVLKTLDALVDTSGWALGRFTLADVAAAPGSVPHHAFRSRPAAVPERAALA